MASKPLSGKGPPYHSSEINGAGLSVEPAVITAFESVRSLLWFATAAIFFAAGVGTGGWVASIPRICRDFALSAGALGAGLPAIAGGSLIATVLVPAAVRCMGSARASLLCASLFMFSVIGPTLAGGFPILLLPFIALGFMCGATDICMNAYASGIEQIGQRPMMSSFHASQTVGMLVGVASGGAIAGLGGTTTMGAIGTAALMAASLTVAAIILWRENQLHSLPPAANTEKVGCDEPLSPSLSLPSRASPKSCFSRRLSLRTVFEIPLAVFFLGITLGAASLMQNGLADWGGVYCVTVLGLSEALSGSGFSCLLAAIVVSRLIGDRLVARWGPILMIQGGALLIAIGYVAVWLAPSMWTACMGFMIVGLGLGNLNPVIFGLLGRTSGHPAKAISVAMAINYVFAMAGPVLIGIVAEWHGLRQAFLGLAVTAALVATVLATLIKRTGVARSGP